jgi:CubicO group peptidase (beta-lactamase class C family)
LRTAVDGDTALMHPSTLDGMLVPRTLGLPELIASDERKEYGLAWQLRATSPGLLERRAFGHSGLSGTQWWIYPDLDAAFVLLTNLADPSRYGVDADELNNAFVSGL